MSPFLSILHGPFHAHNRKPADPERIVAATLEAARIGEQLAGKTLVVSAGPTREPIDPVRFVTNRSSGRMGYALAAAAARRGARVVLVSGPVDLPVPYGVERVSVRTGEEMRRAIFEAREGAAAIFMAAASATGSHVLRRRRSRSPGSR